MGNKQHQFNTTRYGIYSITEEPVFTLVPSEPVKKDENPANQAQHYAISFKLQKRVITKLTNSCNFDKPFQIADGDGLFTVIRDTHPGPLVKKPTIKQSSRFIAKRCTFNLQEPAYGVKKGDWVVNEYHLTECYPHGKLANYLKQHTLPIPEIIDIARQICDALVSLRTASWHYKIFYPELVFIKQVTPDSITINVMDIYNESAYKKLSVPPPQKKNGQWRGYHLFNIVNGRVDEPGESFDVWELGVFLFESISGTKLCNVAYENISRFVQHVLREKNCSERIADVIGKMLSLEFGKRPCLEALLLEFSFSYDTKPLNELQSNSSLFDDVDIMHSCFSAAEIIHSPGLTPYPVSPDIMYVGEWNCEDQMHGGGVEYHSNGSTWKGYWESGVLVNGTCTFANGDKYTGERKGYEPNGYGILIYGNGDMYEGMWHGGMKHGRGTLTTHAGLVIAEEYVNGERAET